MKKIIVITLALIMLAAVFLSCAQNDAESSSTAEETSGQASTAGQSSESYEISHKRWEYKPHFDLTPIENSFEIPGSDFVPSGGDPYYEYYGSELANAIDFLKIYTQDELEAVFDKYMEKGNFPLMLPEPYVIVRDLKVKKEDFLWAYRHAGRLVDLYYNDKSEWDREEEIMKKLKLNKVYYYKHRLYFIDELYYLDTETLREMAENGGLLDYFDYTKAYEFTDEYEEMKFWQAAYLIKQRLGVID